METIYGLPVPCPVELKDRNTMPAPAYTDYTKIYIGNNLVHDEFKFALFHESLHNLCKHNVRRPKTKEYYDSPQLQEFWTAAVELEIARNFYTDNMISIINNVRSNVAGSYVPDSIPNLPEDLMIAEDIYQWLQDNPNEFGNNHDHDHDCCMVMFNDSDEEIEIPKEIVKGIIESIKNDIKTQQRTKQQQQTILENIRYKKPSMIDEIDALLRNRVERERTYRRESRYHDHGSDLILKGSKHVPRPPKVEIYVDRSGSFSPEKTHEAERTLQIILEKYGSSIEHDVYYFSDSELRANDVGGGGNTPYSLIHLNLLKSVPKLAIIITDNDGLDYNKEDFNPITRSKVFCVPIGCSFTNISVALNGTDFTQIK